MYTLDNMLHTCCFIGHREICETEELRLQLYKVIEKLIIDEKVDTFLFGSKSLFNNLCYELVTEIKEKHLSINRIYVRAEYPEISQNYEAYLLENYEYTYYPSNAIGAGKAVYIRRNIEMINKSHFCVFYYKEDYMPKSRKSGTRIVFDYATKHNKIIYQFPK